MLLEGGGLERKGGGWMAMEKESGEETSKRRQRPPRHPPRHPHKTSPTQICPLEGRWTMEQRRGILVRQAALGENNGHYALF